RKCRPPDGMYFRNRLRKFSSSWAAIHTSMIAFRRASDSCSVANIWMTTASASVTHPPRMVDEHRVDDLSRAPAPPLAPFAVVEPTSPERHMATVHDQCLPQRPAAASGPGAVVEVESRPELLTALAVEERPGDRQVTRRIADTAAAEVDDRNELAVGDEQVR